MLLRDRIVEYDRAHRGWAQSVMGRRVIQKLMKRMQKRAKRKKAIEKEKEANKVVDELLGDDSASIVSTSSAGGEHTCTSRDGVDSPGSAAA